MDNPPKPAGNVSEIKGPDLKLSPQEFGKILDALRGSTATSTASSDKRRFNRVELEAKLSLASLTNGHVGRVYSAMMRDISINGLGHLQSVMMAPGETFLACLPLGKEELIVKCRATFCRGLAEGIFTVGAEFVAKVEQQAIPASNKEQKAPAPRDHPAIDS
jgi:hypothetical protein